MRLYNSKAATWKLRIGLHYAANRSEDRLLFEHQRTLAAELGYEIVHHRLELYGRKAKS